MFIYFLPIEKFYIYDLLLDLNYINGLLFRILIYSFTAINSKLINNTTQKIQFKCQFPTPANTQISVTGDRPPKKNKRGALYFQTVVM